MNSTGLSDQRLRCSAGGLSCTCMGLPGGAEVRRSRRLKHTHILYRGSTLQLQSRAVLIKPSHPQAQRLTAVAGRACGAVICIVRMHEHTLGTQTFSGNLLLQADSLDHHHRPARCRDVSAAHACRSCMPHTHAAHTPHAAALTSSPTKCPLDAHAYTSNSHTETPPQQPGLSWDCLQYNETATHTPPPGQWTPHTPPPWAVSFPSGPSTQHAQPARTACAARLERHVVVHRVD